MLSSSDKLAGLCVGIKDILLYVAFRANRRYMVESLHTVMENAGVKPYILERAMKFNEKMNVFKSEARDYTNDLPPSFRVETKLTQYTEDLIGHPLFQV